MNCAQHADRPATAYCQSCGKALCAECTRSSNGRLLCPLCLECRQPFGWTPNAGAEPGAASGAGPQTPYTPVSPAYGAPPSRPVPPGQPSPFLAGLLGFIPGVGAMYNGQFVKGLIHVVIFIVLIGMTQHFPLGGLLVAAWEFYQVFDAAHTASARRDGRPVPDPLGLLDLSQRLVPGGATETPRPQAAYPPPAPPPPPPGANPAYAQQPPAWQPGPTPGAAVPPVSPGAPPWEPYYPPKDWGRSKDWGRRSGGQRSGEPVGALILIALGVLFLLNTLDVFSFDWIGRGWPLILLGMGIWLLIRRSQAARAYMPPQAGDRGTQTPPPPPPAGSGLSINPYRGAPTAPTDAATTDTPKETR